MGDLKKILRAKLRLKWALPIAIGVLLLLLPIFFPVKEWLLQALETLRDFGAMGLLFLAIAYVFSCVLMLPGTIFTLGAGFIGAALWPGNIGAALLGGGLAASLGGTLGATCAFLLARTILRELAAAKLTGNPRFKALDTAIGKNGFKMVFLVRLSPLLPFNVLNYALGLTKVRLRDFVLASWTGMFPGMMLYVYLGATAHSLTAATGGDREKSTLEYTFLVLGLIATIVVVVMVARVAGKVLQEAMVESEVD